MADRFPTLLKAILEDDRGQVGALLNDHVALARAGVTTARYESTIAHWIYAGDSALHVAAAGYRVELAELLLELGANCRAADNHRKSQPLHYAADGNLDSISWNPARQVQTIKVLLKAGADIHARDKNGATPLHRAVRTRCADAVKSLLDSGANPVIQNKPGSTPFHLAVQYTGRGGSGSEKAKTAQIEIIEAFLERGVSPALKDAKGKSVLEWAKSDRLKKLLGRNDQ